MTDRVKGFTVTLDHDVRIDDIEHVMNAIKMIRGVVHVEPSISTSEDLMMKQRVFSEIRSDLYGFINEKLK